MSQLRFKNNCVFCCAIYNSVTCRELVVSQSTKFPILMVVLERENGWHVSKLWMWKNGFFLELPVDIWNYRLFFLSNLWLLLRNNTWITWKYVFINTFPPTIPIANCSQFWTQSGAVCWHWCFGGTCCLHFQGWRNWIHVDEEVIGCGYGFII